MIKVIQVSGYGWTVILDRSDIIVLRKLADAYGISSDAMIVACMNKGIEVIIKQVQHTAKRKEDDRPCDDIC